MKRFLTVLAMAALLGLMLVPPAMPCDYADPSCDHHPTDLKDFMKQLADCDASDPTCYHHPDLKGLMRLACDNDDPDCFHHPTDLKRLLELACEMDYDCRARGLGGEVKQMAALADQSSLRFMAASKKPGDVGKKDEKPEPSADPRISFDLLEAHKAELPMVTKLLNLRIPVNAQDGNGTTMLMVAASKGDAEMVKKLLDAKADVNLLANNGGTALMYAAAQGHAEVVKLLLKAGADPNQKNKSGASALFWADKKGHKDVVQLFEEAGLTK